MPQPARTRATAESFAHLAGLGRGRAASAEDETDEERRDREQRENDDQMRRMEDGGEDTGESDEDRDERHDREESRRGGARRARGEADDDEEGDDDRDREDMRGGNATSHAFRRGMARCAAIFRAEAAGRNPVLAAQFAFDSSLTRGEAIRALRAAVNAMPRGERPGRAAANPQLGPGGGGSLAGTGPARSGALWDKAIARVTGR